MFERNKDLNEWKDIPCSWIGRPDIFKRKILPKLKHRFSVILMKTSAGSFAEIDKLFLKFKKKFKGPRKA